LLVKRCVDDEPEEPVDGEPEELGAPVPGPGEVGPGVVVLPGVLGLDDGGEDGALLPVPDGLLPEGLPVEPLPDEPLPDVPPPACADASAGARPRATTIPATISFFIEVPQMAIKLNRPHWSKRSATRDHMEKAPFSTTATARAEENTRQSYTRPRRKKESPDHSLKECPSGST